LYIPHTLKVAYITTNLVNHSKPSAKRKQDTDVQLNTLADDK